MSFFAAFPFIRIIFPFIAGIILAIYLQVNSPFWLAATASSFLLVILETYFIKLSAKYNARYFVGFLFFLVFFFLGNLLVQINSQEFSNTHFSKHQKTTAIYAEITEAPIEKKSTHKVIVQIKRVKANGKWIKAKGKILCYISKSKYKEKAYFPKQGDCKLFSSATKSIEKNKNPGQFDYKQYLYYHNIYHQCFIKASEIKFVKREGNPLKNFAFDLRKNLIRSFKNCGLKGNELAVASALLFGVTDQLDPALIRSYAGTGALHVLSVSGLHVAILYGFLQLVFGFLAYRKNGALLLGIITLVIIWFYAFLTGLTPSVLRSSTMFTFIVVGQILSRQSSVYNSIAASAFVLLCYDPFLIMEVGFQLSYLAVIGIILLYPIINRQIRIQNKLLKPVWDITSVSIAAQIATFPLGLLYFHQFPNYFIFSNLIVIPLSGIILYTGIIASVFSVFPIVQFLLVYLIELLIIVLNSIVDYIEKLPYSLIEGISITIIEAIFLYLILVFWLLWYKTSKPFFVKFILLFSLVICGLQIVETNTIQNQKQIIIYQINNHTAIDLIDGKKHDFIADSNFVNNVDQLLFNVKHNWDNLNLNAPNIIYTENNSNNRSLVGKTIDNVIIFGNKSLQLIDSSYNYKTDPLYKTDYILLTKNAKINLSKVNIQTKDVVFIADGSNKFWRIEKWKQQAMAKNIEFYSTAERGAYILELNQ
jgi:competence protein ComEC